MLMRAIEDPSVLHRLRDLIVRAFLVHASNVPKEIAPYSRSGCSGRRIGRPEHRSARCTLPKPFHIGRRLLLRQDELLLAKPETRAIAEGVNSDERNRVDAALDEPGGNSG
jgi:hypothetical protein